jgi:hypothetical protein
VILFYLLSAHFLCDYPLQGPFIGEFKNRHKKQEKNFHGGHGIPWWHLMTAHSFTHGGAVLLITGRLDFAIFETVAHFIIDCLKCEGITDINFDQFLHIVCKVSYAAAIGGWFNG